MADLSINFAGIKSPNPFWLASAPPSNSGYQVQKAFEEGWGGAVWKTIQLAVLSAIVLLVTHGLGRYLFFIDIDGSMQRDLPVSAAIRALEIAVRPVVYAWMKSGPTWAVLLLLILGTLGHHRRMSSSGNARSWPS